MGLFKDTLLNPLFKKDVKRVTKYRKGLGLIIFSGAGGGKTVFSYQLMKEYLKQNKDCFGLYINYEQKPGEQMEQLEEDGIIKKGEKTRIVVIDESKARLHAAAVMKRSEDEKERLKKKLDKLENDAFKKQIQIEIIAPLKLLEKKAEESAEVRRDMSDDWARKVLKVNTELTDKKIERVIELGWSEEPREPTKEDGIWYEFSKMKELKDEYKGVVNDFNRTSELLSLGPLEFITNAISNVVKAAKEGDLKGSHGIKKGAKLAFVTLDSLVKIESALGIDDESKRERRNLWGDFVNDLKDEYGVFVVGILERRGDEHPAQLPESYAFDCIIELGREEQEYAEEANYYAKVIKSRYGHPIRKKLPKTLTDKGIFIGSPE